VLFHEIDLIDTSLEKELSEVGQRFLTEITSAVQIIATREIASGKMLLVLCGIPSKSASNRPNRACIE
jgi:hypothetical protein